MDGYLKIKAKIDDSEINSDVKNLENKIKQLQKDNAKAEKEQNRS